MAVDATSGVTSPIAQVAVKEVPKTVEAQATAPAPAQPPVAVGGESVATGTPTEAQAKKVDVTV